MAKKNFTALFTDRDKVQISISYVCPNTFKGCSVDVSVGAFSAFGGCRGHSDGEFCYCSPPDVEVSFSCPDCGVCHSVELSY